MKSTKTNQLDRSAAVSSTTSRSTLEAREASSSGLFTEHHFSFFDLLPSRIITEPLRLVCDTAAVLVTFLAILFGTMRVSSAQASPSLADFWNTNAVWASDSNNIGSSFGFHCLAAITNESEIWAYYIANYSGPGGSIKSATGRARSTDGLNWTNDGIVMDVGGEGPGPYWDDRLATFPGIWKDGDTWYLVYEGAAEDIPFSPGDIGLATSTDGKKFYKHPKNPILRHNPTGWERGNIGTPSLYKENGIWYLFYHGFNLNFCSIGVATGTNLTNLTKYAGNPVIDVAPGTNAWDCGSVGKRTVVKEGAYYYMAYEGSTRQPYDQAKWSSGLARSTNLFNWTTFPANPVIPQTTSGFGFDATELIQISNVWYMYVRTSDGTSPTKRFRLAATPPVIIAPPQNKTVNTGNNATFSVTVSGTPPLFYQWKFNTTNISGATASSFIRTNAQSGDAGDYVVLVTNSVSAVTSSPATLTVTKQ